MVPLTQQLLSREQLATDDIHKWPMLLINLLIFTCAACLPVQSTVGQTTASPDEAVRDVADVFVQEFNAGAFPQFDSYFVTLDQGADRKSPIQTPEEAFAMLIDLTNPNPALGWAKENWNAFHQRGQPPANILLERIGELPLYEAVDFLNASSAVQQQPGE